MEMDFGGVKEDVVTRDEYTRDMAADALRGETIAVLGYGIQGRAQALNTRDTLGKRRYRGHHIKMVVSELEGNQNYQNALDDGWIPGKTLLPIGEAAERGTIVQLLLQDATQKAVWPAIKPHLHEGDAVYFSHGFSIVYGTQTGVVPASNLDVILVAPKGSGTSVRRNFLSGAGINSSIAVAQDYTGRAWERTKSIGIAIGSGYLFPTTFEKEVYSDLTGERGVLMGAMEGMFEAQYKVLRANGHSPSEAFNETVEEFTQSLIRLVDENGMDFMYQNCSETARIGAIEWRHPFREAVLPVFEKLYASVKSGEETRKVIETSEGSDYRNWLAGSIADIKNSELWRAGAACRSLRPKPKTKKK